MTKEQFEQNLRELCLHKSYNNEKQPGSVENIILRLLGSEYEIRRTNTDEAIGMLESDVVHGKASDDVIILVKK